VQRIDIDTDVIKIIFRRNQNTGGSDSGAVVITVPHGRRTDSDTVQADNFYCY
jgi:hypothetical protein